MWAWLLVEAGAVWVAPTTPGRENTDSKFCVSNRLGGNLALAVQSLGVGGGGPAPGNDFAWGGSAFWALPVVSDYRWGPSPFSTAFSQKRGWDGWFKHVQGSCPKTKPAIVMVSC